MNSSHNKFISNEKLSSRFSAKKYFLFSFRSAIDVKNTLSHIERTSSNNQKHQIQRCISYKLHNRNGDKSQTNQQKRRNQIERPNTNVKCGQ